MGLFSPPERTATAQELALAISRLTPAERLRLRKKAEILLWGTEFSDPMELLNEAVKRAMVGASGTPQEGERGRPWPLERVPLPAFLSKVMESIADASQESTFQTRTDRLEEMTGEDGSVDAVMYRAGHSQTDVLSTLLSWEDRAARIAAAREDVAAIERHFKDDQVVLAILEGEKEGMSAKEVCEMFGFDRTTYDSARRRLRRNVDKLMPGRRQQ